jgi:hypothetical protein
MIIAVQDDHWHYLDQLVRLESAKLIRAQLAHPSKDHVIGCGGKDGKQRWIS